jgi:hypothetical protein
MQRERALIGSTELLLFQDRFRSGEWRVEYFDDDGCCYVALFAGRAAEARARSYFNALKSGKIEAICAEDRIAS